MNPLFLAETLTAFAVLLQSIELFQIRLSFSNSGIWRWKDLKKDLSPVLSFLFKAQVFSGLLALRGIAAGLLLTPTLGTQERGICFLLLAITTLLISVRFRGSFNGGSDSMTFLLTVCLGLSRLAENSKLVPLILGYLTLQVTLSYWVAGLVKIKEKNWRSGRALGAFTKTPGYESPDWIAALIEKPAFALFMSWTVMLFELSFPMAFLSPKLCTFYLSLGVLFHLANVYAFGLNRFFLIWTASYPILFGMSSLL
jgi:hypothetical protein